MLLIKVRKGFIIKLDILRIQSKCFLLPSSAQSEAQLKLSLSSIFAVRPESAIRHPESAIRKSIISNLILATTPKLQPLPSNLQPQLKLILPSSAKPLLQLCWLAELVFISVNPATPPHPHPILPGSKPRVRKG